MDGSASQDSGQNAAVVALRYGVEDKPARPLGVLYGFQHILIMFTAMVASPLVISQMLDLPPDQRAAMLSAVMLGCGIGTLVSALGLWGIGARLPLVLGAYAAYIGPVTAIAKATTLATASTALLVGALVLLMASPLLAKLRPLFPPLVVGTLLIVTGGTLMKIGMGVALGVNTPFFAKPITWIVMIGSVALILVINQLTRGVWQSLSVLITLALVYAGSLVFGYANSGNIGGAPWFRLPEPLPFGGPQWPGAGAISTVIIYCVIVAIYTMSITIALSEMLGVEAGERRLRRAVAGDAFGSLVAVLFGGVPLISYDQNVGAVSLTGVGSRYVVAYAGGILIVMALFPKIGAALAIVPPFMLGGMLLFMFGMIVAIGVRILGRHMTSQYDQFVVATSVALSTVVNLAPPAAFESFPAGLRIPLSDGIVVGTLAAIVLNLARRPRARADR
jgi:NCS2 family nucleobase:cation symporter-2